MAPSLSLVAFNTDTFTSQLHLYSSFPVSILLHLFLSFINRSYDSYSLLFLCFLSIQNQQRWEDFFFLPVFVSSEIPFFPPLDRQET